MTHPNPAKVKPHKPTDEEANLLALKTIFIEAKTDFESKCDKETIDALDRGIKAVDELIIRARQDSGEGSE